MSACEQSPIACNYLDQNVWGRSLLLHERLFAILGFFLLQQANQFFDCRLLWIKHPERIGEISINASLAWVEHKLGSDCVKIYCVQQYYPVANNFYDRLLRRNLPVFNWLWSIVQWTEDRISSGMHRPRWLVPLHRLYHSRDREGLLSLGVSPFSFTSAEDSSARKWLEGLGWQSGEPIVCLLVRDAAYLESHSVNNSSNRGDVNRYRDGDISAYVDAAEWLAGQGAWVFRMGKTMRQPMYSSNHCVVDYAFSGFRSDFLDIWLAANCDLFISTGTGIDRIADIYRKPILYVNFLPLLHTPSWSPALVAPKLLRWRHTRELLSVSECLDASFLDSAAYEDRGILVEDLEANRILEITKEAWTYFGLGNEVSQATQSRAINCLNDSVWNSIRSHPEFREWHGRIHPLARFSALWLAMQASQDADIIGLSSSDI